MLSMQKDPKKTHWKSKKKFAIGTKKTEDPKPPTVPNTSAISDNIIKMGRYLDNIIIIVIKCFLF